MEQKRFVFIKEYHNNYGSIPVGTQIDIVNGTIYINGGMCDTYSSGLLSNIINTPKLNKEYLRKTIIPYNKI